MKNVKRKRPSWFTRAAGRPATFAIAVSVIVLWALNRVQSLIIVIPGSS